MTAYYGRRLFLVLGTCSGAAVVACASGNNKNLTGPGTGGTPTSITKVSGDSQSAPWSAGIPAPLIVKVTDSVGSPVIGTPVSWLTAFDDAPQVQSITTTNGVGETQVAPKVTGMPGAFAVSAAINGHNVTFTGHTTIALAPGAASFSSNLFASCGLTTHGAAFCWGTGQFGQLGDGDTTAHAGVVPVSGGYTFSQVSVGVFATCGIVTGGAVYCWGSPTYSSFGNGTASGGPTAYIPVAAASGRKFSQIAVGQPTVCGLSSGVAYCWGSNAQGAVGDGNTTDAWSPVPVAVPTGVTFKSIGAGGSFNCGLTSGGAAYCWGNNYDGNLGTGSSGPDSSSVPLLVTGGHTFTSLGVGSTGVCGLTPSGTVYCWGEILDGNGSSVKETTPTAIQQTGLTFTQLSVAGGLACALATNGSTYCWGVNYLGSLGSGSFSSTGLTPSQVTGGLAFSYVASGGVLACGVATSSKTYCWGANTSRQLGLQGTADSMYATPQPIPGMGG